MLISILAFATINAMLPGYRFLNETSARKNAMDFSLAYPKMQEDQ